MAKGNVGFERGRVPRSDDRNGGEYPSRKAALAPARKRVAFVNERFRGKHKRGVRAEDEDAPITVALAEGAE